MADKIFKAIADKNRRKILMQLKQNVSLAAGELAEHSEFSRDSLSEDLKILRLSGLSTPQKRSIHPLSTQYKRL